jgi:hypothetical protein
MKCYRQIESSSTTRLDEFSVTMSDVKGKNTEQGGKESKVVPI